MTEHNRPGADTNGPDNLSVPLPESDLHAREHEAEFLVWVYVRTNSGDLRKAAGMTRNISTCTPRFRQFGELELTDGYATFSRAIQPGRPVKAVWADAMSCKPSAATAAQIDDVQQHLSRSGPASPCS